MPTWFSALEGTITIVCTRSRQDCEKTNENNINAVTYWFWKVAAHNACYPGVHQIFICKRFCASSDHRVQRNEGNTGTAPVEWALASRCKYEVIKIRVGSLDLTVCTSVRFILSSSCSIPAVADIHGHRQPLSSKVVGYLHWNSWGCVQDMRLRKFWYTVWSQRLILIAWAKHQTSLKCSCQVT